MRIGVETTPEHRRATMIHAITVVAGVRYFTGLLQVQGLCCHMSHALL